jgi:L1 cell adhesion molecule like protein
VVGDAAKNQTVMNPKNTVFDAKRLIGRKVSDALVQADLKYWPFKVCVAVCVCCVYAPRTPRCEP